MPASSLLRHGLLGALGFICACVAHEAVGHGGACLLAGGRITLLTSVYFRCQPGSYVVDAAGPSMNLAVAAVCWLVLARLRLSPTARLAAALVLAFNAMWGAGYLVYSGLLNAGDWGFVLRDLHARPLWAWRAGLVLTGGWIYMYTLRVLAPHVPSGSPLAIAYGSAGAVALCSVMLSPFELLPALREAAQESLLASVGLLYLALRPRQQSLPEPGNARQTGWLVLAGIPAILAFLFLLGRGYSAA